MRDAATVQVRRCRLAVVRPPLATVAMVVPVAVPMAVPILRAVVGAVAVAGVVAVGRLHVAIGGLGVTVSGLGVIAARVDRRLVAVVVGLIAAGLAGTASDRIADHRAGDGADSGSAGPAAMVRGEVGAQQRTGDAADDRAGRGTAALVLTAVVGVAVGLSEAGRGDRAGRQGGDHDARDC